MADFYDNSELDFDQSDDYDTEACLVKSEVAEVELIELFN